MAKGCHIANN